MLKRSQRRLKLQGPLTGLLTPFNADESVNTDVLKQLADFAIERCHASGIMVAAAEIQEAVRLHPSEKIACMKAVVDAVNGRVPVIAGATDTSTHGSIYLAKNAKDIGVDALMTGTPLGVTGKGTLKPPTPQELVQFYTDLSSAVDIAFLVYNSDTMGTHLETDTLAKIFANDNVVGMEEASLNYQIVSRVCMDLSEYVTVLVRSHILLPGLAAGVNGAIMPVGISSVGARLFESYKRGDMDEAMRCQRILNKIPPAELAHKPGISFYKEALTQLGFKVGNPRKPTTLLDAKEKEFVTRLLHEYGLNKLKISARR